MIYLPAQLPMHCSYCIIQVDANHERYIRYYGRANTWNTVEYLSNVAVGGADHLLIAEQLQADKGQGQVTKQEQVPAPSQ